MALTKAQAIDWINQSIGKHYNPDGAYGFQCKDYADAYAIALFGNWVNTLRPADAKYVFNNSNPDFFEKIRNNPSDANLIPQAGDIIVYDGWASNPHGHIAVVIDANIFGAMVVEQDGFLQIPARKIFHSYSKLPIIGWLRPKYQAETPAVQVDHTWRTVSADQGVNVRNEPTTKSGIFATYPKNSEIQMRGWCKGQKVANSDVWFVSARSAKFIHSSAFDKGTEGLPHLPEFDKVEVAPEKKAEIQAPPAPKPAEFVGFEKEFDFVDRVEPVATSNQFYGRKNLKDEQGKYLSAIPDDYASQKAFVDSLDRPTAQIEEITIHNTANTSVSATLNEFRRKDSYKSSHLVVSNSEIVQCVRKTDTAFTNGSHESNIKSFTIEFLDDVSDDRYAEVLAKVSKALGVEKIGKHRDHSATACPAKLTDEKFAEIVARVVEKPVENHIQEVVKMVEAPVEHRNDKNVSDGDNLSQGAENKPKTDEKTRVEVHKNDKIDMSHNVEIAPKPDLTAERRKVMSEISKLTSQAQEIADAVEFSPVIPEEVKLRAYFTTGTLLILTTLVSSILMALVPTHAVLILAIAGALNTAYAHTNQLFKISSKK